MLLKFFEIFIQHKPQIIVCANKSAVKRSPLVKDLINSPNSADLCEESKFIILTYFFELIKLDFNSSK